MTDESKMTAERFCGQHAEGKNRVFRGLDGGIVTRDSAGSTSGWTRGEALKLRDDLTRLLEESTT